jgi:hypothetical protein
MAVYAQKGCQNVRRGGPHRFLLRLHCVAWVVQSDHPGCLVIVQFRSLSITKSSVISSIVCSPGLFNQSDVPHPGLFEASPTWSSPMWTTLKHFGT